MKFDYCHSVPQQYIDTKSLSQYIDDLKTRIYKAFYQKSRLQVCHLQALCTNSSLVILMAAKSNIEDQSNYFDLFELGYLTFSLSGNLCLDASFYAYYRENTFFDAIHLLSFFIGKIKHNTIVFCIEPCQTYLFSRTTLPFVQFEQFEALNNFLCGKIGVFNQVLSFKPKSYFSYFHMHALIKRLLLHSSIKLYLLKYLSHIKFKNMMSCFCFSSDQAVLTKNGKQLFAKMLNILIYLICNEIYAALDSVNQYGNRVLFVNYNLTLLILSKDYFVLNLLTQELSNFSCFNGIKLIQGLYHCPAYLFNSNAGKLLFIVMRNTSYPFNFVIRPSLFSQFNLMRRISFIISYSVSQPLFLLTIRLNKLLLDWMNKHICCTTAKILYLIDYLTYLKLRLFAKRHRCFVHSLLVSIFFRLNDGDGGLALNRLCNSVTASVFTDYFYRHYVAVKMFWIYALKCLSS